MRKEEVNGLSKSEIESIYPKLIKTVNESGMFGEIFDDKLRLKTGYTALFQGFFEIKRIGKDCYNLMLIF